MDKKSVGKSELFDGFADYVDFMTAATKDGLGLQSDRQKKLRLRVVILAEPSETHGQPGCGAIMDGFNVPVPFTFERSVGARHIVQNIKAGLSSGEDVRWDANMEECCDVSPDPFLLLLAEKLSGSSNFPVDLSHESGFELEAPAGNLEEDDYLPETFGDAWLRIQDEAGSSFSRLPFDCALNESLPHRHPFWRRLRGEPITTVNLTITPLLGHVDVFAFGQTEDEKATNNWGDSENSYLRFWVVEAPESAPFLVVQHERHMPLTQTDEIEISISTWAKDYLLQKRKICMDDTEEFPFSCRRFSKHLLATVEEWAIPIEANACFPEGLRLGNPHAICLNLFDDQIGHLTELLSSPYQGSSGYTPEDDIENRVWVNVQKELLLAKVGAQTEASPRARQTC